MTLAELSDKKIVFLGLGVNNQELLAYLVGKGILPVVRDRTAVAQERFAAAYPEKAEKVRFEIGERIFDKLTNFDLVFRSPAIPYLSPPLQAAKNRGVQIYSQTRLFFDLCPCQIIGISGTKGKGTTATLTYQILESGYHKGKVYLAGNIGVDPFSFLDDLQGEDLVVLELSSFQLQDLEKSPHVAVLLNVTQDHLDHHRDFTEYTQAKRQLLSHQGPNDIAIINADYPLPTQLAASSQATVYRYSRHQPSRQAAWLDESSGEEVIFYQVGDQLDSFSLAGRRLLGAHNLENILPAVLVGALCGVEAAKMGPVVRQFPGLEHRLSYVGHFEGVDYYNDSMSTTPESCLVALQAFTGRRVHLIAGGKDKGQHYERLAPEILSRCVTVSLLPGQATARLRKALLRAAGHQVNNCSLLDKAQAPHMPTILSGIYPHLRDGDVVLLAPSGASDKPFANYKERGEAYTQAVLERFQKEEGHE